MRNVARPQPEDEGNDKQDGVRQPSLPAGRLYHSRRTP